jgi:hypothetical protein
MKAPLALLCILTFEALCGTALSDPTGPSQPYYSPNVRISPLRWNASQDQVPSQQFPDITLGADGTIYIVWAEGIAGHMNITLSKSSDGGKTFDTPVQVNRPGEPVTAGWQNGPQIAVDSKNGLIVAWSAGERGGIRVTNSTDG